MGVSYNIPPVLHSAMVGAEPQGNLTGASVHEQLLEVQEKSFLSGYKNKIINGNFDIWQRGTNFPLSSNVTFTADRWQANYDGTIGTAKISQAGYLLGNSWGESTYGILWNQTAAGSGSTVRALGQKIENVRTLHNKKATLSFTTWADTTRQITPQIVQYFGDGGSPSAPVTTTLVPITISPSANRYSVTFDVPSVEGKSLGTMGNHFLWVRFLLPVNVTMQIGFAQIQLEEGSVATPFESRHIAQELFLCQRYYRSLTVSFGGNAHAAGITVAFPVLFAPMRAIPTPSASGTTLTNVSGYTADNVSANGFRQLITVTGAGAFAATGSNYILNAEP